jgi:hypothetical protein
VKGEFENKLAQRRGEKKRISQRRRRITGGDRG